LSDVFSEESFFDFKCPYCGENNSFPASAAHSLQDCAGCAESLIVPESGAEVGGRVPLPITTARLIVRPFLPDDGVPLLKLDEQDESALLPITETNVDQWIGSQMAARFTRAEQGVYLAIELAESKELVGYVLLTYSDAHHHNAGFFLSIAPARRRQGLGLEAARAAIDFIFDGLCASRVAVSCASKNVGGRRLLEKAGLRQEGEFLKSSYDGNDWVDVSWYAILKDERPATTSS
jgi:[ribosomal protein S5]-alanine N-acetyltransferase